MNRVDVATTLVQAADHVGQELRFTRDGARDSEPELSIENRWQKAWRRVKKVITRSAR